MHTFITLLEYTLLLSLWVARWWTPSGSMFLIRDITLSLQNNNLQDNIGNTKKICMYLLTCKWYFSRRHFHMVRYPTNEFDVWSSLCSHSTVHGIGVYSTLFHYTVSTRLMVPTLIQFSATCNDVALTCVLLERPRRLNCVLSHLKLQERYLWHRICHWQLGISYNVPAIYSMNFLKSW